MKTASKNNHFYFIDDLKLYLASRNKGKTPMTRKFHCWLKLFMAWILYLGYE